MRAIALALLLSLGLIPASHAQDQTTNAPAITTQINGEQVQPHSPTTWRIATDEDGNTIVVITTKVALDTLGRSVVTALETYAEVGRSPEEQITLLEGHIAELEKQIKALTEDRDQRIVELRRIWVKFNTLTRERNRLKQATRKTIDSPKTGLELSDLDVVAPDVEAPNERTGPEYDDSTNDYYDKKQPRDERPAAGLIHTDSDLPNPTESPKQSPTGNGSPKTGPTITSSSVDGFEWLRQLPQGIQIGLIAFIVSALVFGPQLRRRSPLG